MHKTCDFKEVLKAENPLSVLIRQNPLSLKSIPPSLVPSFLFPTHNPHSSLTLACIILTQSTLVNPSNAKVIEVLLLLSIQDRYFFLNFMLY